MSSFIQTSAYAGVTVSILSYFLGTYLKLLIKSSFLFPNLPFRAFRTLNHINVYEWIISVKAFESRSINISIINLILHQIKKISIALRRNLGFIL